MPRNRPKKGKKYDEESLKQAIQEVQRCIDEGRSYSKRAIAKRFGIGKDLLD